MPKGNGTGHVLTVVGLFLISQRKEVTLTKFRLAGIVHERQVTDVVCRIVSTLPKIQAEDPGGNFWQTWWKIDRYHFLQCLNSLSTV